MLILNYSKTALHLSLLSWVPLKLDWASVLLNSRLFSEFGGEHPAIGTESAYIN